MTLNRVLDSFILRNAVVLAILLSASVGQKTFLAGKFDSSGFYFVCLTFTSLYLLFIFHNRILYEHLVKARRFILYGLALGALLWTYNEYLLPFYRGVFGIEWEQETVSDKLIVLYSYYLVDIYIGLGLYMFMKYYKDHEEKLVLQNLSKTLELRQLKDQLNPHFLFNALNNIYSYSLEKNGRSEELILRLSELMRFTIDNAGEETIPVKQEIMFIEHFISFEKERLGNRCTIELKRDINDAHLKIAPFLLFTFVENALKHGTASIEPGTITIGISIDADRIELLIRNRSWKNTVASTKTGIPNAKRRLELLYPGRHVLELKEEDGYFATYLEICPAK